MDFRDRKLGGCRIGGRSRGSRGAGRATACACPTRGRGQLGAALQRFGGWRTALVGVVVDVPSGTLEAQAGRSERAFEQALALGTFLLRLGREVLDLFKAMTAHSTTIGI